jgi:hypothetical protein
MSVVGPHCMHYSLSILRVVFVKQKCEDGPAPLLSAAAKPESVVRDISALRELNELLIGQPSENYPYKTTKRLTVQVS